MARISLKNILGKKKDAWGMILSLIDSQPDQVCIEDEFGLPLLGCRNDLHNQLAEVRHEGEVVGRVIGGDRVESIAGLLEYLLQKESEKKKLGSEVLNLYQEINMIFNFSERLAQATGVSSIAEITLSQAGHVIQATGGMVLLWDDTLTNLLVTASAGRQLFDVRKMNENLLISNLLVGGQSEIITDTALLKQVGAISEEVQTFMSAAVKVKNRVLGAVILLSSECLSYTAGELKILTTLALQASSSIESALLYEKNIREAREREEAIRRVYEVTEKFVPYEFIGALGHKIITEVKLGDQVEKVVTVLFSDIRDYTMLSEEMTPGENFRFVCSFNERMGPIIRKNGGFINQYLGDAIMAIFPGGGEDALQAAVAMQKEVREFNKVRSQCNEAPIRIGVGMHTGPLIMGITGDQSRLDATTISDTVNTASRLESLTKYYRGDIILSEETARGIVSGSFHLRALGSVQLKGKQEPIQIHECFSGFSNEEIEKKSITLQSFNKGISSYISSSFSEAADAFQDVLSIHPGDQTASFFLQKVTAYLENGTPHNWVGVEKMQTK